MLSTFTSLLSRHCNRCPNQGQTVAVVRFNLERKVRTAVCGTPAYPTGSSKSALEVSILGAMGIWLNADQITIPSGNRWMIPALI